MVQKGKTLKVILLRYVTVALFVVLVASLILSVAQNKHVNAASNNGVVNFQARLLTSTGAVVPDGSYNIQFRLYDKSLLSLDTGSIVPSSGSTTGSCGTDVDCEWQETYTGGNAVSVLDGYVSVSLGSLTSFPSTIKWEQPQYLTMNIGGIGSVNWDGEMGAGGPGGARIQITAVPYAFNASQLSNNNTGRQVLSWGTDLGTDNITLPDASGSLLLGSGTGNVGVELSPSAQQSGSLSVNGAATVGSVSTNTIDAASGTLSIGTSTVSGITVGGTGTTGNIILGQGTGSNTISIGSGSISGTSTQYINIGTGAVSSAAASTTIGSATANSTNTLNAGNTVITENNNGLALTNSAGSPTEFQVSSAGNTSISPTGPSTSAFLVSYNNNSYSSPGVYSSGTTYYTGNIVQSTPTSGVYYVYKNSSSSTGQALTNTSYWQAVSTSGSYSYTNASSSAWSSGTAYSAGNLVQTASSTGIYYVCITTCTAGQVQPSNTTYWILLTSNLGNLIQVDTTTSNGTVTLGSGSSGTVIIGSSTNGVTYNATTHLSTLTGSARQTRNISLTAEYAGAVIDSTYVTSADIGTLTAGVDTTYTDYSGSLALFSPMNYYNWTTASGTAQSYDIVTRVQIPQDFSAWSSSNPLALSSFVSATSGSVIDIQITDTAGHVSSGSSYSGGTMGSTLSMLAITPTSPNVWTTNNPIASMLTNPSATYTPGQYMTIRIRLTSTDTTSPVNVRIGDINLSYLTSF